jgi:hypothetical protein
MANVRHHARNKEVSKLWRPRIDSTWLLHRQYLGQQVKAYISLQAIATKTCLCVRAKRHLETFRETDQQSSPSQPPPPPQPPPPHPSPSQTLHSGRQSKRVSSLAPFAGPGASFKGGLTLTATVIEPACADEAAHIIRPSPGATSRSVHCFYIKGTDGRTCLGWPSITSPVGHMQSYLA